MDPGNADHRRDEPKRTSRNNRRTTMKTMFLTLAAVLGFALGTASLTPAAHAAWQYTPGPGQFHPANGGNR
jgi:hypothetical protein